MSRGVFLAMLLLVQYILTFAQLDAISAPKNATMVNATLGSRIVLRCELNRTAPISWFSSQGDMTNGDGLESYGFKARFSTTKNGDIIIKKVQTKDKSFLCKNHKEKSFQKFIITIQKGEGESELLQMVLLIIVQVLLVFAAGACVAGVFYLIYRYCYKRH